MATRKPQTWAKREREQAVKERRDRKRAKKAAAAAARNAPVEPAAAPEPIDDQAADAP